MGLHKGIEFVERILRLSERFERPGFEQMRILVVGVKTNDFLHVSFCQMRLTAFHVYASLQEQGFHAQMRCRIAIQQHGTVFKRRLLVAHLIIAYRAFVTRLAHFRMLFQHLTETRDGFPVTSLREIDFSKIMPNDVIRRSFRPNTQCFLEKLFCLCQRIASQRIECTRQMVNIS